MPFQVSPGVNVTEIDLTTVVPAVSTTEGAIAGVFRWGPVGKRILVDSEQVLAATFGKPNNNNYETFFTAANFLSYGNKLYVVRTANTTDVTGVDGALTAYANVGGAVTNVVSLVVRNEDSSRDTAESETNVKFIARYPGALGNSLKVSVCDTVNGFSQSISLTNGDANLSSVATQTTIVSTTGSNTFQIRIANSGTGTLSEANTRLAAVLAQLSVGDLVEVGNSTVGTQYLKVTAKGSATSNDTTAYANVSTSSKYTLDNANTGAPTLNRYWEYATSFDKAPGTSTFQGEFGNTTAVDEVHTVVVDEDGSISGVAGTILEAYQGLSRATDAKTPDGNSNYMKDVINNMSKYVYHTNGVKTSYFNAATALSTLSNTAVVKMSLGGGSDGSNETGVSLGILYSGYDLFKSAEDIDVSLVLQGKARGTAALANYIIDNICESRKDCVAFISPTKETVVNNSAQDEADDIVTFRNSVTSTSYGVMDSGYKYQYDKYNDVYRYVPLNGDIAGLCVRTDETRDAWWSPAGFNRGIIKNSIKLAFNPRKSHRDGLYKAGVNPVVTFPGQGTLLYGDKTLLAKPSAFDRINVRRLFIVLEKAIATAAKYTLFEFNDPFTRAQFKNLVEPFLRDVQGRRGIYDFKVVCDETNNTPEVIDRNEFVGDIYIKPAKSINFIQLNFVAVRTGVEFSEIVGRF